MSMIECHIKKVPDGKTLQEYLKEVRDNMHYGDYAEGAENWIVDPLTEQNFEEYWELQENLKQTDEIKQKYFNLAKQGKAILVEIEW